MQETKKCIKCNQEKHISEFRRDKSRKDGYQFNCKNCKSSTDRSWRDKNKVKINAYMKEYNIKRKPIEKEYRKEYYQINKVEICNRIKTRRLIAAKFVYEYKKEHGCCECLEKDPRCLDFDHFENKEYNIGCMIGRGMQIEKIIEEMKKCNLKCANCHRKKTAKDFDWYKDFDKEIE